MPRPVLIVEDDDDVRVSLEELLADEGYTVLTANHGREALDVLKNRPDTGLVLLDWMMPVMNGREFLAARAARRELLAIPVVIMTAQTNVPQDAHVRAVLRKPVDPHRLLEVVKGYCDPDPMPAGR